MQAIKCLFSISRRDIAALFTIDVLALQIVVVKVRIKVLVIIDPGPNLMGVLFSKVGLLGFAMQKHWLVIADVVGGKSLIAPENHFTPQVGMLAAVVHSGVRLKILFDVKFVLFKHNFNFLEIGILLENFVKIAAHCVLLVVESVKVNFFNGEHVLGHQFTEHASAG